MRKLIVLVSPKGTRPSKANSFETNIRKIIARLVREGWRQIGGGRHDKFELADRPELLVIVPRHREVSLGVAREIARKAGW